MYGREPGRAGPRSGRRLVRAAPGRLIMVLAVIAVVLTSTPHTCLADQGSSLSFVHVVDGKLLNDQGATVYLDGFNYKDLFKYNLYGWGGDGSPDWSSIRSDLAGMASLGAKAARVWFNWIYYEPTPGQFDSQRMLSDMQGIVETAKANNLYVILTIYVKDYDNMKNWLQADTSTAPTDPNSPDFWLNDGDAPAQQRGMMLRLWQTISQQFKGEATIAAYDIINEAHNKYYAEYPQWMSSPRHHPLERLYDDVIKAIRENGDNHIVIVNPLYEVDDPVSIDELFFEPLSDNEIVYDLHLYNTAPLEFGDVTGMNYGPWDGRDQTWNPVSYTYPDSATGHDKTAISAVLAAIGKILPKGYLFYLGEFGFTENSPYNRDVAELALELGLSGFLYFEYCPRDPIGSAGVVQAIASYFRAVQSVSQITIKSKTASGLEFTSVKMMVDAQYYATEFSANLQGKHVLTASRIADVNGVSYSFLRWEDESGTLISTETSVAFEFGTQKTLYVVYQPPTLVVTRR